MSGIDKAKLHSARDQRDLVLANDTLIAALAGLKVPFLCTETPELGEELVAS